MSKLTAISLFSGCGGFDFGASQAGVDILWANDIDDTAAAVYKSIFPNVEFIHGDITGIESFPNADILIGCYPCTGFSVAARRRWKSNADRDLMKINGNFLYREFLRVLKQNKPKYFFVENVRGMITAHDGWFFNEQIKGFKSHGYAVKHKCLHAEDFGLAQTRQRIFIVGIRNDIAAQFSYEFPKPTHGENCRYPYRTLQQVLKGMPLWPKGDFLERSFHGHYLTRNRKRGWGEQSYTIVSNASHVPLHPEGMAMKFVSKDKWMLQGDFNRRLSWRECACIQGLPKIKRKGHPLENLYKVVGNAVPPIFGKVLLLPIVKHET